MSKILPTIGPISEDSKSIKRILSISKLVRINGSHGTLEWHTKIANRIKKISKDSKILLDVPGIKPRTANKEDIFIKKNEVVYFYFKNIIKKKYKSIEITNPLPKINKLCKSFSISDGQYDFSLKKTGKNFITGKSRQSFVLKPKKGLNIPYSEYDELLQGKKFIKFLQKFKNVKFDAIGLSFVQDEKILYTLRKKFPQYTLVSKIENLVGLRNNTKIIKASDVIMIDRGDLSAEIGEQNLFRAINDISVNTKKNGKSLIMATENLDSMIHRKTPTKSEIVSLGHALSIKADKIMLSDETATSDQWRQIVSWLQKFIVENEQNELKVKKNSNKNNTFWSMIENITDLPVVIFSRKGYAFENFNKLNPDVDLTIFTDNKKTATSCMFRANTNIFLIDKFSPSNIDHIYKSIKQNSNLIFKKSKKVLLIYITYPRKNSRANTISLISKEDFS